jgi:hypothetical protein
MKEDEIRAAVAEMDTANNLQKENAWLRIRDLGQAVVPYLAEAYPRFKKWQGRVALVFHLIRFGRSSDVAYQLGLAALRDRSTMVRYRGCGLLAYSLRRDALPHLEELLANTDEKTVADSRAAIDAIMNQNHHYFQDRNHSGRTFWVVNKGDSPET